MTTDEKPTIRILLHAPTGSALQRARNNAANILKDDPAADVRIVVNAEAVAAALDQPDPAADARTWVCPNTLRRLSREPAASMTVLPHAAALALALLQREGWIYVRA
ncbi:hypothetical protein SRS16CHR_00456 [Variovorax sp. SRS16]|uniref:hypothetical protein n=1 Tax=Variovorax sp. SRS16 TaxID=282217 RepID=UPI0013162FFD|nr:hypothetical protein [Variovorax sp. SRS16]VTU13216.1 hypothetical protein SRS16CHR_00456 [Variovorax sp. SRS16]